MHIIQFTDPVDNNNEEYRIGIGDLGGLSTIAGSTREHRWWQREEILVTVILPQQIRRKEVDAAVTKTMRHCLTWYPRYLLDVQTTGMTKAESARPFDFVVCYKAIITVASNGKYATAILLLKDLLKKGINHTLNKKIGTGDRAAMKSIQFLKQGRIHPNRIPYTVERIPYHKIDRTTNIIL